MVRTAPFPVCAVQGPDVFLRNTYLMELGVVGGIALAAESSSQPFIKGCSSQRQRHENLIRRQTTQLESVSKRLHATAGKEDRVSRRPDD